MNGFLVSLPAVSVGYFAARAATALILGAVIGLERQWRQRTAGLRTNAPRPGRRQRPGRGHRRTGPPRPRRPVLGSRRQPPVPGTCR